MRALALLALALLGIAASLAISAATPDCNNWLEALAGLEDCNG